MKVKLTLLTSYGKTANVMNLRLYTYIVLFMIFGLRTKVSGQVITKPNYQIKNFTLDMDTLGVRLMQSQFRNKNQINQNLNVTYLITTLRSFPKAELVGRNQDFDIYKLPVDQMLCLVPNEKYNIDMKAINGNFNKSNELATNDNMPNLFEKQEFIPSNK